MTPDAAAPRQAVARTRGPGWRLATAFLAIVNLVTFLPHYLGRQTFPWDFIAGYHANAYGWYKAGSLFSPPDWLPWSDMGFPAFMALQAGAWYLPLALLDAAGIDYTIHVATALQCLHVLGGALGAFFLFRRYGFCGWTALLGALGYHFTAAFFSGQQFADIVRAAALLPWVLLSFTPGFLRGSRLAPAATALLLWQFLVAAYPGNIVATAYASALAIGLALAGLADGKARLGYLRLLVPAVVAGLLMAMIKWYPVLAQASHLDYQLTRQVGLTWKLLATLWLPYDVDSIGTDLALRSFWLPFVLLWGAMFTRLRTGAERLGAGLATMALAMAVLVPAVPMLRDSLPGAGLSRFQVSDWRPVFQLGLILVSLAGWTRVLAAEYAWTSMFKRSACFGMACVLAAVAMLATGYPVQKLQVPLAMLALMGVACGIGYRLRSRARIPALRPRLLATLGVLVCAEGLLYQMSQPLPWRAPWDQRMEYLAYGSTLDAFGQPPEIDEKRRPARYVLGTFPDQALRNARSLAHNRCWYSRSYCVLGYNNLKMSAPHIRFHRALASQGGGELLAFARRPQQLLVLPPGTPGEVQGLTAWNLDAGAIGPGLHATDVEFLEYSPGRAVYRITTAQDVLVVENEIWWPGWTVTYCDPAACTGPLPAGQTPQGLRSWPLQPGTWRVTVEYESQGRRVSYVLFFLGLLLAILLPVAAAVPRRTASAAR